MLWLLPVLAAVALGIAFLRCAEKIEEDETLEWKTAWEIPVNLTMPVDTAIYDEVQNILNGKIIDAVPEMTSEASEEFASIILEHDTLIRNILSDTITDLRAYLLNFMNTDPAAKELLNRPDVKESLGGRSLDDIAREVAEEVKSFKEETDRFKNVPLPIMNDEIPALEGMDFLRQIDPRIGYKLKLENPTPFSLSVYALIFEQKNWQDINSRNDTLFLDFIKERGYQGRDGYVNPFNTTYDTTNNKIDTLSYLKIKAYKPINVPPLSKEMDALLTEFVKGKKSLAWRWVAVIDGELGDILKDLVKREPYDIDVELSIKVEGTLNLDTLFRLDL
jgi:hypothetical protein